MSKGHRSKFGGAFIGQIRETQNEINNDINGLPNKMSSIELNLNHETKDIDVNE